MDEVKLMGAVVAVIAMVRSKWSKVDGPFVPLMAMVLGAGAWWLRAQDIAGNLFAHGALGGLAAVGGMTLVGYGASKASTTIANVTTSLPPPPPAPTLGARAGERGVINIRELVAMALASFGLLALVAYVTGGCTKEQAQKVETAVVDVVDIAHKICSAQGKTDAQCITDVLAAQKRGYARLGVATTDAGAE